MATRDMIITIAEVLAVVLIFAGFAYEDRLVAFEGRIADAIKRRLRGE